MAGGREEEEGGSFLGSAHLHNQPVAASGAAPHSTSSLLPALPIPLQGSGSSPIILLSQKLEFWH